MTKAQLVTEINKIRNAKGLKEKNQEKYIKNTKAFLEYQLEYLKALKTKITREEAKNIYCKGENVYITTNSREYWKIPASYEYGSHAPAEELFNSSIPQYEGNVEFYKA